MSSTAVAIAASTALPSSVGLDRLETVRKFLRDEAGRQPALAPARMLHQRRQERHVVLDAVDHEFVERIGHRIDRRKPGRAPRCTSLAIIGS